MGESPRESGREVMPFMRISLNLLKPRELSQLLRQLARPYLTVRKVEHTKTLQLSNAGWEACQVAVSHVELLQTS